MDISTVPVITIDGPSGSGKGTVGQLLANNLKWHFLDSGAVYRVFALSALSKKIVLDDVSALERLALQIDIGFSASPENMAMTVLLFGVDVTEDIRQEECGRAASHIAAYPQVRKMLLQLQRNFCKPPGLVADGRDMGTIVFPEAVLKLFLTASCEERAQRRFKQLQAKGIRVSLHDVFQDLERRDRRDTERTVAPLKPAADAIIIDTTKLSIDEVVNKVLLLQRERVV